MLEATAATSKSTTELASTVISRCRPFDAALDLLLETVILPDVNRDRQSCRQSHVATERPFDLGTRNKAVLDQEGFLYRPSQTQLWEAAKSRTISRSGVGDSTSSVPEKHAFADIAEKLSTSGVICTWATRASCPSRDVKVARSMAARTLFRAARLILICLTSSTPDVRQMRTWRGFEA